MGKLGWFLGGAAAGYVLYALTKSNAGANQPCMPQLPDLGPPPAGPSQEGGDGERKLVWPPCPDKFQYRHPSGKCMDWCKGNKVYDKAGNCIPNPCQPYWSYLPDFNICIKGPFA